ncbi:MAG: MFS transporter [Jatrophihabitans sp.]
MRSIWRLLAHNRDYRCLILAGVISLTGDWALRVGLAYYVYLITGSTVASGLMVAASILPQLMLGSIAGVFVDRWDRRRTMVTVSILLGAALLPLLAVQSAADVWIVYLVAFVEGILTQFFLPAEAAVIPSLVDEADLITANAVNSQTRDTARLVGSAIGGILASTAGVTGLTFLDAGSFLTAAILLLLIGNRVPARLPATGPLADQHLLRQLAADWQAGITTARRSRILRSLLGFALLTGLGEGVVSTLFAPFVRSVLHGTAADYGVILSAQAAGGIAGGLVAAAIAHRFRPEAVFLAGTAAFGALDLVLFCYPLLARPIWPALVLMVVIGLPGALLVAGLMTIFQQATSDSQRGRIFGTANTLEGAGMLIGALGAGWLAGQIGIVAVISIQAAAYLCSAAVMRRPLRRLELPVDSLSSVSGQE